LALVSGRFDQRRFAAVKFVEFTSPDGRRELIIPAQVVERAVRESIGVVRMELDGSSK
jgi:hypothetical protein